MKSIFNENNLHYEIKVLVKKEFETYRGELNKIWDYLNKLRDEIKATQSLIEVINKNR